MKSLFKVVIRSLSTIQIQQLLSSNQYGFDKVLRGVNLVHIENGNSIMDATISEDHVNPMNIAHGGYIATLVDTSTSLTLLTHKNCQGVRSVSTDINLKYLKPIKVGAEIKICVETIKCGKNLALLECKISDKVTGKLYVMANHTKFIDRSTL